MHCEAELCVNNKNFFCSLEKIQLDPKGSCYEYNAVAMPDECLKMLKERLFRKLEKIHKNSGLGE